MEGAARTHDVLVATLRQPDLRTPPPELVAIVEPSARRLLAEDAVRHRVEGVLHLQTQSLGWSDEDGAALLRGHRDGALARHLQMVSELFTVTRLLDDAGIPTLAFKGPVLAECTYPRPDLRSYGDIDVLLSPRHLRPALELLRSVGTQCYSESWAELRRTERAQLNLVTSRGVQLDLHWQVYNNPGVRAAFPTDSELLLRRRRDRRLLGRPLHGLAEADELVFLAVHAAQSGGGSLVWALDLHLAAAAVQDWEQVVQAARLARTGLVTAVMLARTQYLLGTAVPDGVLDQLSSARGWRRALHAVDRWRPPQRSRLGTGRVLMTSTRHSTLDSCRQLFRSTWSEAVLPFATDPQHPWRRALSGQPAWEDHSGHAFRDLGPSPEREAFLSWVEAGSPRA